jgi:hypothetical protein
VLARGDKCWLGFRAIRMIWLRVGNITNAMCWEINPLSLEHEGRSSIFYCARTFGIIGGTGRTIFDSLAIAIGGGEIVRGKCGGWETRHANAMQRSKKFRTGTGEMYRYPDARVTASAVWRCCIFGTR